MTTYTFPKTALESARVELDEQPLEVLEGAIPSDLVGHVFVVAANGDMDHPSPASRGDNTPFLNGDGFVYRVTFRGDAGPPTLSCKAIRTPCFIADQVAHDLEMESWEFENYGIARISILHLGGRNFANTALVPIPPKVPGGAYRLFASYDAGRPFEIDPVTLRTVQPIGLSSDWVPTLMTKHPFPFLNTSAHPIFDPTTRELFSPNFVRDTKTLIGRFTRWLPWLDAADFEDIDDLIALVDAVPPLPGAHLGLDLLGLGALAKAAKDGLDLLKQMLGSEPPVGATHLVRWTEQGLDRWEVLDENGEKIELLQSSHQIGITRDHVILVDTVFKFEADHLWSDLPNDIERLLRARLSKAQPRRTPIYIIRRADLVPGAKHVHAVRGIIDAQVVHFMTNYELHDGKIVMHIVDQRSSDAAEFVADSDLQHFTKQRIPRHVVGGLSSPMDVNGFGPALIDPATAHCAPLVLETDADTMFGIGLMTAPDYPMAKADAPILRGIGTATGPQPTGLEGSVFFYAHGFIPSLLSELVWDLYENAPHPRMTPAEVTDLAAQGGTPATVCRFDTIENRVVDRFTMPAGQIIGSPQLVPAAGGKYFLFSTVFLDDDKQIWIFDASDLAGGPLCKLRGTGGQLPWPYTLHTCWMPPALGTIDPVTVDNAADFAHVARGTAVYAFLENEVFPKLYE